MTRRSSTRALPRVSAGRCGSIFENCCSVSQNWSRLIRAPCSEAMNQNHLLMPTTFMGPDPRVAGRKCRECGQLVPYGARICPSCKTYQDWRRYISIGQSSLPLLVALISVLTTFFSIGLPLLRSHDADVKILYENSSGTQDMFFFRNDGRSGALVRILGVFVFKHSKEAAIIQLYQKRGAVCRIR